jgi:hypothetical protein
MASERPGDDDSVGDDPEVIEFVLEEPIDRHEPDAGGKDRPPHRRGLLVLALAAVVVAIAGVGVAVSRDDSDAEAEPTKRRTSSASGTARIVSYLRTLATSLPKAEWEDPTIRSYVASRFNVRVATYANNPDRVIPVPPPDLSLLLGTFPARAAQILGGREALGPSEGVVRGPEDPMCFEVTLDEARTLADEFLTLSVGGSHQYSGIVLSNPELSAIQTAASQGIVVYINFQALLPHAP